MNVSKRSFRGSVAIFCLVASGAAYAQTEPASAAAQQSSETADTGASSLERALDDIVVTGRKRDVAERAQDVPIALSAYSAAALRAAHVQDLTDIANLAPSVRLTSSAVPGYGSYFIRGASVIGTIPSNDPAVGVFINGMPLGTSRGSLGELFDLASIEVLRGPQGTLFGRNVTGGAILLTTARPSGDFHANLRGGIGNAGQWELSGGVEGATKSGAVAVRLAFLTKHTDGFFHDLQSGTRAGERDVRIVRPTVVFKPTETLTIAVSGEVGRDEGDGGIAFNLPAASSSITRSGYVIPSGKFDTRLNTKGYNDLRWKHVTVNSDLDVGVGTITSVTAWRAVRQKQQNDTDGASFDGVTFNDKSRQHQFSQELRFAGRPFGTDAIQLTVGGSMLDQSFTQFEGRFIFGGLLRQALEGTIDHKQYGLFAQTDIELPLNFTLTAGARYSYEKKSAVITSLGGCTFTTVSAALIKTACTPDFTGRDNWKNLGPKVGLQWKPSDEFLAYASWTRGFRSGGFNSRNTPPAIPGPYDPETVDAYEIGLKSELLDRKLRINLAAYINKAKDLQEAVLDPTRGAAGVQTILNAADATTKGFEAEVTAIPVRGLVLTGAVGYVDAKYDSFRQLDLTGDRIPDPALAKLLKFALIPKWTASASATYEADLGSLGTLTLRGAYSYVDDRPNDVVNQFILPSYELVDASAALALNEHVTVTLYGKNLTNEVYSNNANGNATFRSQFIYPGRTWLAEVALKF